MHVEALNPPLGNPLGESVNRMLIACFPNEPCEALVVDDPERAKFEPELERVQVAFSGKSWRDVEALTLPRPLDSVTLLTASAFRKIFPAYLNFLTSPEVLTADERQEICDIVRWSMRSINPKLGGYERICESWWNSLSRDQRTVTLIAVTAGLSRGLPFALSEFLRAWADQFVRDASE